MGITPAVGSLYTANTSPDKTRTTLTINITVDHFRNKLFNYTCFFILSNSDEVESKAVIIDPIGECVSNCSLNVLLTSALVNV